MQALAVLRMGADAVLKSGGFSTRLSDKKKNGGPLSLVGPEPLKSVQSTNIAFPRFDRTDHENGRALAKPRDRCTHGGRKTDGRKRSDDVSAQVQTADADAFMCFGTDRAAAYLLCNAVRNTEGLVRVLDEGRE